MVRRATMTTATTTSKTTTTMIRTITTANKVTMATIRERPRDILILVRVSASPGPVLIGAKVCWACRLSSDLVTLWHVRCVEAVTCGATCAACME